MISDEDLIKRVSRVHSTYDSVMIYGEQMLPVINILNRYINIREPIQIYTNVGLYTQVRSEGVVLFEKPSLIDFKTVLRKNPPRLLILGVNEIQPTDHWLTELRGITTDLFIPKNSLSLNARFMAYLFFVSKNRYCNWRPDLFLSTEDPFFGTANPLFSQ